MPDYENLLTEQTDGVLTVVFNRPKVNAFSLQMIGELLDVLKLAKREHSIRCLVLMGSGGFFSTGHDVGEIAQVSDAVSYRHHLKNTYNRVIQSMRQLEKPIVGAINGVATGAGLGIALATDIRWAVESARFIFGFTGIGLTTDSGISLTLPLFIGMARAFEMAFTNQPLTAEQAFDYGLVSKVVADEEFQTAVNALAASIASGPTRALGLTKRAFNRTLLTALDAALDYEAYLQEIAARTEDHKEGVAAFLDKRPPDFRGA